MTDIFGIKIYTLKEGAKILAIGKNKIYEMINNGEIEHVAKAGRKCLTEQIIKNYIARNTVSTGRPNLYPKR